MSAIGKLILILFSIGIGINLSANNSLISLLDTYIFYKDKTARKLIRPLGLLVTFSSLLYLTDTTIIYGLIVEIFVLLIIVFFSITGRSRAYNEKAQERERLLKEYREEIEAKQKRIHELKQGKTPKKSSVGEGKSVQQIKKEMWNDGSMTNKDLLDGFKKG